MSEMSSNIIINNGVNRCPVGEQHRPGRHHKTARTEWSKETNIAIMECYFLSRPFDEEAKLIRRYRKRMHGIWKERQDLKVIE